MITTKLSVKKLISASKKNYLLAILTDVNGKPIEGVKIGFADNGVKYIQTDSKGASRYFIDHLSDGEHTIKVAFFGNDTYKASDKIPYSFWIGKIQTTLTVSRKGDYLIATLKDAYKKPVKDVSVGFADNGVKYIRTDNNGIAKYNISHFGYGTFTIRVKFFGDDDYKESEKIIFKFTNNPPKPSKKKYGHSKEHCCDDMGQNTPYYCACHSLQEVFRNLTGIVVPQSTIASVCGTTTNGTGHSGMNTCVVWFNKKYGYNLKVEWKNFFEIGWNGIRNIINSNDKDCIIHNLYRLTDGHYEVINKIYGDYCDVQNSLGSKCSNGCYYGYVEERYLSTFKSYINGISQKSVMVITNA